MAWKEFNMVVRAMLLIGNAFFKKKNLCRKQHTKMTPLKLLLSFLLQVLIKLKTRSYPKRRPKYFNFGFEL